MKFMKYALITLIIAVATDILMIYAYPSPPSTSLVYQLKKNNIQQTDWKTKNTWTTQKYKNTRTYTILTDPCPNCYIASKPIDASGNVYQGIVTSEGQTQNFINSALPGDYRLNIWRSDPTLLTTIHSAIWTMNG